MDTLYNLTIILIIICLCADETFEADNLYQRDREDLTKVPGGLSNSQNTGLKFVSLIGNLITTVSDCAFCKNERLERVYLGTNLISYVSPTAFAETGLIILMMNNNKMTEIPQLSAVGGTLEVLGLRGNQISSIPDGTFNGMRALQELSLKDNLLKEIQMGSSCFKGLNSLLKLWLGGNALSGDIFSRIKDVSTSLSHLKLDDNDLINTPPHLIEDSIRHMVALAELTLTNTHLILFPDIFHDNPNFSLTLLDLEGNDVSCDKSLMWLKDVQDTGVKVKLTCLSPVALINKTFDGLLREELDPRGEIPFILLG